MDLRENISLAVSGLLANKMRALLTMLGIIIGIASVITIVTVGNSVTGTVSETMQQMGGNNILISLQKKESAANEMIAAQNAMMGRGTGSVTEEDLISDEMLAQLMEQFSSQIEAVSISESVGSGKAQEGHLYSNLSVSGVSSGYKTANDLTLLDGRFFTDRDNERGANVAVISDRTAKAMLGEGQSALGKELRVHLNGEILTFTVVGVYEYEENPMMAGMAGLAEAEKDITTSFYIPLSTAKKLTGGMDGYKTLSIVTKAQSDPAAFAGQLENFFNVFYKNNPNYQCTATSMDSIIGQMSSIMGTVSLAIALIAAISLLVGGIGVMNIMLVSITERTREIGTRKALGATNSSIRIQFIVESVIICLIGGIIGILLGVTFGIIGANALGQPARPTLSIILIAVSFSMLIGVFFGYYPANKAAKMDPIEALRYE